MGVIKVAVKVGLATTAVYYINEQGIWKTSTESLKTYEQIKATLCPYVKQATDQLPFELPTLPESDKVSSLVKQSWNGAVLATFKFVSEVPEHATNYTKKGVDKLLENEEIRNFVNSFKGGNVETK